MGTSVDRFLAIVDLYERADPNAIVMEADGLTLCVAQLREVAQKMAADDRTAKMLTEAVAYGGSDRAAELECLLREALPIVDRAPVKRGQQITLNERIREALNVSVG